MTKTMEYFNLKIPRIEQSMSVTEPISLSPCCPLSYVQNKLMLPGLTQKYLELFSLSFPGETSPNFDLMSSSRFAEEPFFGFLTTKEILNGTDPLKKRNLVS